MPATADRILRLKARPDEAGSRLDRFLAARLPDRSRSEISRWIRAGAVTVSGRAARPAHRVVSGDEVRVAEPAAAESQLVPEAIPLDILYEDESLVALVKPAGMVVHPGAGHQTGTLVHALLGRGPRWSAIGGVHRPGLVHRLDRDTSGIIVVARTDAAHRSLAAQFRGRHVRKEYLALVWGEPEPRHGRIRAPIGRNRRHREKMAIRSGGREAETSYAILEDFRGACLLTLSPLTGRTHQIRLHLFALGYPVIGDPLYGGTGRVKGLRPGPRRRAIEAFGRLALHAWRLELLHPEDARPMVFEAPPPADFRELADTLRATSG